MQRRIQLIDVIEWLKRAGTLRRDVASECYRLILSVVTGRERRSSGKWRPGQSVAGASGMFTRTDRGERSTRDEIVTAMRNSAGRRGVAEWRAMRVKNRLCAPKRGVEVVCA